ncbi:MAG: thiamine diphosphokinase [Devosia sp. 67-54]|uniref:thiamine diphosphokinase n=1 Tax=unclassified Devosia TaxID=196773 RepID=UPI000869AC49|nr:MULTISPECIES: thiamine diphosphokinase [unclassified Devosia]MBN9306143.1 thiamine diphosphokinase [Devosia sp.]ODU62692.1 MAG: thiamine diphosphokinase [Pelagibacterium sp. SCN 68-10]OJX16193.1 MAG: thiamine diphosphokinase [Devosia sp. 67-54]
MQERASNLSSVLRFEGLLVIVGGGTVDFQLIRDLAAAGAHLVGADGGADRIVQAGHFPEAIIGDFDSLATPEEWLGRTRLLRISEQDTTDFEKALYSTQAPVTLALGMTGRRFDHTLAALDAVTRYARERTIILVDEEDLAMALTGAFSFKVDAGERVSVHPLAPIRFRRSLGLRYPLDGLRLAPGERTGTSNQATDGVFRIEPEPRAKAPWLLIVDRKYLFGIAAAATARS